MLRRCNCCIRPTFFSDMFFPLIIASIAVISGCTTDVIVVNDTTQLSLYLCHNHFQSNTTLIITPSVLHIDDDADHDFDVFCFVQNVSYIKIMSAQSTTIVCSPGKGGFGFFNTTNVTLDGISFKGCGAEIKLPSNIHYYTNESADLCIGEGQRTVLLFTHCLDTVVSRINITESYNGFAILAINALRWFQVMYCVVSNGGTPQSCDSTSPHHDGFSHQSGNGLVIVYMDSVMNVTCNTTLSLQYITITNTTSCYPFSNDLLTLYSNYKYVHPIVSGTGVSLVYSTNYYFVFTFILDCHITGTVASHAGAMLLFYHNTHINHPLFINRFSIQNNSVVLHSPALSPGLTILYSSKFQSRPIIPSYSSLTINNGYLAYNTGYKGVGILIKAFALSFLNTRIQLSDLTFFKNRAQVVGSACHVEISAINEIKNLQLSLYTINATLNSDIKGGFDASVFSIISTGTHVLFKQCSFTRNKGSTIEAYGSYITLGKTFLCEENTSFRGSCILLRGTSFLHLNANTNIILRNNYAHLSGGAIYSDNLGGPSDTCTILLHGDHVYLVAEGNKASMDGDVMRISSLYNCTIYKVSDELLRINDNLEYFLNYLNYHPNSSTAIVSRVSQLIMCDSNQSSTARLEYRIYPGVRVQLPVIAVDAGNHLVYTTATLTLYPDDSDIEWRLSGINYYNLYAHRCNVLSFAIFIPNSKVLSSSGFAKLQSTENAISSLPFQLTILNCPLGFNTSESGKCVCSDFISDFIPDASCDIQMATITLPPFTWYGNPYSSNSSESVSFSCPLHYCITPVFNTSLTDPLCADGRTGIMCGQCTDGLSVTFGSDKCVECSDLYLFVLLGYALVGVVLVFVLFTLRITISRGIVGGVIFYANMSSISLYSNLLSDHHAYSIPVRVLLSVFNLSTGFTLCFYNGMTSTVMVGMSFVFPVYLCMIVVVLVVLSRYSSRVANLIVGSSVQVLATIVHLSFAKLLSTVTRVLTMTRLIVYDSQTVSNHLVWYYDGSVEYLSGDHLILVIVSLLVIVLIILPYLVFTLFASYMRSCRRLNLYLHPLIDAYHAQYRTKYGYWCGVRQCILVLLYIMYSVLRGTKPGIMLLVNILCIFGFSALQLMLKPFKSCFVNCFESWLMFLLCFTDLVTYFFIYGSNAPPTTQSSIVVSLLLLLYFLTVAGLLVWKVGRRCHSNIFLMSRRFFWKIFHRLGISTKEAEWVVDSEIREPLLYGDLN